jgi:tetratricopeptide (TPR) repeat protein
VDRHTTPLDEPEELPPVLSGAPAEAPREQPRVPKAATDSLAPKSTAPDKDGDLLTGAREALAANRLENAMALYAKLIKKGRLLEDVLQDLRDAVYRHPVDVVVWQTLGDAYMRANRLQEALDAYTKAEDLLR